MGADEPHSQEKWLFVMCIQLVNRPVCRLMIGHQAVVFGVSSPIGRCPVGIPEPGRVKIHSFCRPGTILFKYPTILIKGTGGISAMIDFPDTQCFVAIFL